MEDPEYQAAYRAAHIKYPKEKMQRLEQNANKWESTFLNLKATLKPMIEDQKENIKVHKENMDLKTTVFQLEREMKTTKEKHQVQVERYKFDLKSMGHTLEAMLQYKGQSRGTALLNSSFAMGDVERIDKVLKERSDFKSSGIATPVKPHQTTKQIVHGQRISNSIQATQDTTSTRQSESESVGLGGTPTATK